MGVQLTITTTPGVPRRPDPFPGVAPALVPDDAHSEREPVDPQLGSKPVAWWRRQPVAMVDPHALRLASTPINPRAVHYYRRKPNGRFRWWDHDGDPCVVIGRNGVMELRNGKHRALAARAERRLLRARIYDERTTS